MSFQVRIGITQANAQSGTGTAGTDYIELPISSTYKTTSTTLVDSSRNAKGDMIGQPITVKRKIELSWRVMSIDDYAKLGEFFNTNFTFYAYYFDQDTKIVADRWQTRNFYVGDRVADALQNKQWKTTTRGGLIEPEYIENLKLSLIEV